MCRQRSGVWAVVMSTALAAAAFGGDWYVSSTGSAQGDGSIGNPWSLAYALSGAGGSIQPGDTVWLRGSSNRAVRMDRKYSINTELVSSLAGQAGSPIKVRGYPGEYVVLDTGTASANRLRVSGSYTWYMDFEVMSSGTDRVAHNSINEGATYMGVGVTTGYDDCEEGNKLINLCVHDVGNSGFEAKKYADGLEIYGCLIYYNGYYYPPDSRPGGHAIYTANRDNGATTTRMVANNIAFGQYNYGYHVYTQTGNIDDFTLSGNIGFDNGLIAPAHQAKPNLLVAGDSNDPNRKWLNTKVEKNSVYCRPGSYGGGIYAGYLSGCKPLLDPQILDNYSVSISSNTFSLNYSGTSTFNGNTFYGITHFVPDVQPEGTGNTISTTAPASGVVCFVRKNDYTPGRGHIAIFNWDDAATAYIDSNLGATSDSLSDILQVGDRFEIRDAQDYYGEPVVGPTVYTGADICVPLLGTGDPVSPVIGTPSTQFTHTPRQFNAYIVSVIADHPLVIESYSPETPFSMPEGKPQVFEVWATDGKPHCYSWKLDGVTIGGATASRYTYTPDHASAGAHSLQVILDDGLGNTPSHTWAITVTDVPSITGSLLVYYKFNEESGTTAHDLSGNGHDGTLTNGPTWAQSAEMGRCLNFDGANDYVETNITNVQMSACTVAAWYKCEREDPTTVSIAGNRYKNGFNLMAQHVNDYSYAEIVQDYDANPRVQVAGSAAHAAGWAGNWHHLAMTWDGSYLRVYEDGILKKTVASAPDPFTGDRSIKFGQRGDNCVYFKGKMAEARVYNWALSGTQIVQLGFMR